MAAYPFSPFLSAFVAGIAIRSLWGGESLPLVAVSLLALAPFFAGAFLYTKKRESATFAWGVVALLALGLAAGIMRTSLALADPMPREARSEVGVVVELSGSIVSEPVRKSTTVQAVVRADSINGTPFEGGELLTALLHLDPSQQAAYGERVSVRGKLELPKDFDDEHSRSVPYARMLAKDGIGAVMWYPAIRATGMNEGNPVVRHLFEFKELFSTVIRLAIPEPSATLGVGLLLGGASRDDLVDDFRRIGVSHIVAVSGYNLTIVAGAVEAVLRFLPASTAFASSLAAIVLFAIMTGSGATVIRAAIMAGIALLAKRLRRTYSAERALALAAGAMLLENPLILIYDVSFQLSFLATLALIYAVPIIVPKLSWIPKRGGVRDIIAMTLAAEIVTLPLILASFGDLPLVGLIANTLIIPLVPAAMLFVFCTGVVGMIFMPAAVLPALAGYATLGWMVFVSNALATLPFASIAVPISWWAAALLYLCLIGMITCLMLERGNKH